MGNKNSTPGSNAFPQGKQFEKGATRMAEAMNKATDTFAEDGHKTADAVAKLGTHMEEQGQKYAESAQNIGQAAQNMGDHIHQHGEQYAQAAEQGRKLAAGLSDHLNQHGAGYAEAAREGRKLAQEAQQYITNHGKTYAGAAQQVGDAVHNLGQHLQNQGENYAGAAQEIQGLSSTINTSMQENGELYNTMLKGQQMMDSAKNATGYIAGAQVGQAGAQFISASANLAQAHSQSRMAVDLNRMATYGARMAYASEEGVALRTKSVLLQHLNQNKAVVDAALWQAQTEDAKQIHLCVGDSFLASVINQAMWNGEISVSPFRLVAFEGLQQAVSAASGLDQKVLVYFHSLGHSCHRDALVFSNCSEFVLISDSSASSGPRLCLTGPVKFVNSRGILKQAALFSDHLDIDDDSEVGFVGCTNMQMTTVSPFDRVMGVTMVGMYELCLKDVPRFAQGEYEIHFGTVGRGPSRHEFIILAPLDPEPSGTGFVVHARILYNGETYRTVKGPSQDRVSNLEKGPGMLTAIVLEPLVSGTPFATGKISSKIRVNVFIDESVLQTFADVTITNNLSCHDVALRLFEQLRPESWSYYLSRTLHPESQGGRSVARVMRVVERREKRKSGDNSPTDDESNSSYAPNEGD